MKLNFRENTLNWNISHLRIVMLQIEYQEKKKAEGKKARDDKDAVLNMLFAAFEKHQYYNIKDLQKVRKTLHYFCHI